MPAEFVGQQELSDKALGRMAGALPALALSASVA